MSVVERKGKGACEGRRREHHQNDVNQWRSTEAMTVREEGKNMQGWRQRAIGERTTNLLGVNISQKITVPTVMVRAMRHWKQNRNFLMSVMGIRVGREVLDGGEGVGVVKLRSWR